MTTFTINVPIELTAAQIIRNRPSTIDAALSPATEDAKREAAELAQEAHAIIAEVQARYVRLPRVTRSDDGRVLAQRILSDDEYAFMLTDLVDAVRRTLLGFWSASRIAAVHESDWLEEQLTAIDDDLYVRYLRLCDRIQGTNLAAEFAAEAAAEFHEAG